MRRIKRLVLSKPEKSTFKPVKVRLDHRTTINIPSKDAMDFWKKRYPKLQVVG